MSAPSSRTTSSSTRRRRAPRTRPSTHAGSAGGSTSGRSAGGTSPLDTALAAALQRHTPAVETFAELGLSTTLVATLASSAITRPSSIQASAIPDALAGRDLLGRAQTGSGKTLAFGLPMLSRLASSGTRRTAPGGLVLVPTRELAAQVTDALAPGAAAVGLRITTIIGGASIGRQIDEVRRGVDIVVATPGRLVDLLDRRAIDLGSVAVAVVDEADHMADLGFLPAVTKILDRTPHGRQCLFFSATLDRGVDKLAARYLSDPAVHAVGPAATSVGSMEHRVFASTTATRCRWPRRSPGVGRAHAVLRAHQAWCRPTGPSAGECGVEAGAIHGNLNQNQRTRALDGFSSGRIRVLVATDVAARGIHVDDVDLVMHYDLPNDHKDYLHRSGRTARAGATGTVIAFVEPHQAGDVAKLHAAASVRAEAVTVSTGHPAVRAVAASGEPIAVVHAPAASAEQSHRQHAGRPQGSRQSAGRGRSRHSAGRSPAARRGR